MFVVVAGAIGRARASARRSDSEVGGPRRRFCRSMSPAASRSKRCSPPSLELRGQVDMLINCAGVNSATPYLEVDRRRLASRASTRI